MNECTRSHENVNATNVFPFLDGNAFKTDLYTSIKTAEGRRHLDTPSENRFIMFIFIQHIVLYVCSGDPVRICMAVLAGKVTVLIGRDDLYPPFISGHYTSTQET